MQRIRFLSLGRWNFLTMRRQLQQAPLFKLFKRKTKLFGGKTFGLFQWDVGRLLKVQVIQEVSGIIVFLAAQNGRSVGISHTQGPSRPGVCPCLPNPMAAPVGPWGGLIQ
jgi:hypothetical protein